MTDFAGKRCKKLCCVKSTVEVFFLYTEIVNILHSFLTRTPFYLVIYKKKLDYMFFW